MADELLFQGLPDEVVMEIRQQLGETDHKAGTFAVFATATAMLYASEWALGRAVQALELVTDDKSLAEFTQLLADIRSARKATSGVTGVMAQVNIENEEGFRR